MTGKIGIFQFNGCNKCFNETLLLQNEIRDKILRIAQPKSWNEEALDIAVITGFLTQDNIVDLRKIRDNSKRIIAFGSCPISGGIFGLAFQKGHEFLAIHDEFPEVELSPGCLGIVEELSEMVNGNHITKTRKLCDICARKSTCDYLDEVYRQIDLYENEEACYNDLGYICSGYIAQECKEQCINHGTPCRGCRSKIDRSGIRMLGMFGTLMANVEVATEATGKGGTDKLADEDDDITEAIPDVVGNFFRFSLPKESLPLGRQSPTGSLISDIFIGRTIEELPLIMGQMGGEYAIYRTLNIIEAYESKNKISISEETKNYRQVLRDLETKLQVTIRTENSTDYKEISDQIRIIAGNLNLSNLFYGGFKTLIPGDDNFESYKYQIFEINAGDYQNETIRYTLNENGIVMKFQMEEL